MVDKKSKIFLWLFSFFVLISISITCYRYVVNKDMVFFTDEEEFNQALQEE